MLVMSRGAADDDFIDEAVLVTGYVAYRNPE
jgi:hypothetical protein